MEGERLRPGLDELLAEADYIVTSAHFPQVGRDSHGTPHTGCLRAMGSHAKKVLYTLTHQGHQADTSHLHIVHNL